ncbi:dal82p [Saccharomyces arboricola H-6]|uniref:Dal82p n=1 Tax=Saccharomyces arboricola (strain H-6 / AS 2.3317 / CBS 10644) TaxID=1160507 RepID=J8PXN7_SACAR|nr:dal82p [Saccharomyces arboricola H-6]
MDESVDPVELLLRLLIRHKPHLKPYAYRQDSWQRVLNEYNRQTGSRYRQSRTLKTKFRRLKDLFGADRAQFSPSQLKLMCVLLDEVPEHPKPRTKFGNESSSSSSPSSSSFIKSHAGPDSFQQLSPIEHPHTHSSDVEDEQTEPQLLPLDSITIGIPPTLQTIPMILSKDSNGGKAIKSSKIRKGIDRFDENVLPPNMTNEQSWSDSNIELELCLDYLHNEIEVIKKRQEDFEHKVLNKLNILEVLLSQMQPSIQGNGL